MAPIGPSDRQVRADVYRIARAYLEIERGLRTPEHLRDYLTPAEYQRHRERPNPRRTRTGEPVLPTDIGRIHLDRNLPGQITATLSTREAGERWGALVLHFACNRTGRWRINQLERLNRPSTAREPTRRATRQLDLDQRIERIEEERRLVDAAHRATRNRLTELRRDVAAGAEVEEHTMPALRQQQQTWKRRRSELDQELDQLRDRRHLRAELADVDVLRERHPTELSNAQLEQVLGPAPENGWRRRLREGVIEEIHGYRQRWNVTDPHRVLGPTATDPEHRRDRDELADTLRASARALGTSDRDTGSREEALRRQQLRSRSQGIAAER